jgi:hypothetical protein
VEQPLSRSVLKDTCARTPNGDHDGRVDKGYLFICLQPAEPVLGTRGSSGAALSQKMGARAQVIRGGPGAALSREVRARATGTRGGPRAAPSWEVGARATGTRGVPRAASSRKAGAIVLT